MYCLKSLRREVVLKVRASLNHSIGRRESGSCFHDASSRAFTKSDAIIVERSAGKHSKYLARESMAGVV